MRLTVSSGRLNSARWCLSPNPPEICPASKRMNTPIRYVAPSIFLEVTDIPDHSARAVRVHDYLTHNLINKYAPDHASAEQTASAWKSGRSAKPHNGIFEYLNQTLGVEAGLSLPRSILEDSWCL